MRRANRAANIIQAAWRRNLETRRRYRHLYSNEDFFSALGFE